MTPFHTITVLPDPGSSPGESARSCLERLLRRLGDTGRGAEHVLSLTFLVAAREAAALQAIRSAVHEAVQVGFPGTQPPTSVVGQPPERDLPVALEAVVLLDADHGAAVERRSHDGFGYTVVAADGGRQIHAAGLASADETTDAAGRAREAIGAAEAILGAEGLDFGHVVRQWNYLEEMLDVRTTGCGDSQGYQAFNDVRSVAYGRSSFPDGYPAATGIGQQAGGIVIELIAVESAEGARVEALSNPQQIDAHRYSEDVLVGAPNEDLQSTTSPKFERGKLIGTGKAEIVFVSGTASILGEKTVGVGDVRAQTHTTIQNMQEVLGGRPLTHLRAYVKSADDIEAVREECRAAFGDIPAVYVEADVCRDDLLVELEGESVARRSDS